MAILSWLAKVDILNPLARQVPDIKPHERLDIVNVLKDKLADVS